MGFRLGTNKGNQAVGGEVRSKLRFGRKPSGDASIPGTPVIRKKLEEGVLGEANMDGSIYISDKIVPGSAEERQVINHEMRHSTDMKLGKLAYSDDDVTYNGKVYPRKTINGKDMIIVDGIAKEVGSEGFPWEKEANNGNKNGTV